MKKYNPSEVFKAEPLKYSFFSIWYWGRKLIYIADKGHDVFIVPRGQYHLRKNPKKREK